jgi:hypothetical protein
MRFPPSLFATLVAFFTLGPLLFAWSLLLANAGASPGEQAPHTTAPLSVVTNFLLVALLGAFAWLAAVFMRDGWVFTLLPTALAAVLYWVTSEQAVQRKLLRLTTRFHSILASSFIACVVSTATFAVVVAVTAHLSNRSEGWFPGNVIAIVSIDSALLGVLLGVFWRERSDA